MAQQGVTTGADLTLTIITATQGQLDVGKITKFSYKEIVTELSETLLNGRNENTVTSHGWEFSCEALRSSSELENYFKKLSDNRRRRIHEVGDTAIIYITEPNGKTSRHTFTGVKMVLTDAGEYEGAKHVKQKIHARCSEMI